MAIALPVPVAANPEPRPMSPAVLVASEGVHVPASMAALQSRPRGHVVPGLNGPLPSAGECLFGDYVQNVQ